MEQVLLKKPDNPKERNLIKGAIRRVFSRSELRRRAVEKALVKDYVDPNRPRVTKWGRCSSCKEMTPLYKMQVDHDSPIVPVDSSLEEMSWDQVIDNVWCDERNLKPLCETCHKSKTKEENATRRKLKKDRKNGKT